jgi:nicotinate-nucleotide pyrophosphorylase (carboxylating)
MNFSPEETAACRRLVELALEEDLGPEKVDLTTQAIIPAKLSGRAVFVARAPGVVAGLPAVELVLSTSHSPLLKFQPLVQDGDRVQRGDRLATVVGIMQFILMTERIALNFLQHLSGIATLTRRFVDAVAGLPCQILDTRKTTPGWRLLEKYAVRCGGGHNHRMGLYDGILIKDNHLAALGGGKEALGQAARAAATKQIYPPVEMGKAARTKSRKRIHAPVEIEVEKFNHLKWAFLQNPDIILLDNMPLDKLHEAVLRRNKKAHYIQLEASGGITLDNVRAVAETGVDRISVGALTHSAPALDIALDYES